MSLSRPVVRALDDGLISRSTSVLDYGCGRGGDVKRLQKQGIDCRGYDPSYFPNKPRKPADVVNLGYVVNVVEDQAERSRVLERAWALTESVLIVSARLEGEGDQPKGKPWRDGILTTSGTFQKLYSQQGLRHWIETTLETDSFAAAPGIFYVFRAEQAEQAFLAARVLRRGLPSSQSSDVLFEQNEGLLTPLMGFVSEYGRLPRDAELPDAPAIIDELGSVRRAFHIIRQITGEERWDRVRLRRSEDLVVYLALSRFHRRPRLSQLPPNLQNDIKDFFGSYKAGCAQADGLLFCVGEAARVVDACDAASVGKRTRDALYVHASAVDHLPPILRTLEGCARVLVGTVEDANIIKFHLDRPRVSYLAYTNFDEDAHPALQSAYVVDLARIDADFRDYSGHPNPPILHRKELFVDRSHPLYKRFARLSAQEARLGLFGEPHRIGTKRGWEDTLALKGVVIRGHRAYRQKAAAPIVG